MWGGGPPECVQPKSISSHFASHWWTHFQSLADEGGIHLQGIAITTQKKVNSPRHSYANVAEVYLMSVPLGGVLNWGDIFQKVGAVHRHGFFLNWGKCSIWSATPIAFKCNSVKLENGDGATMTSESQEDHSSQIVWKLLVRLSTSFVGPHLSVDLKRGFSWGGLIWTCWVDWVRSISLTSS